jgi:hypothetical protein
MSRSLAFFAESAGAVSETGGFGKTDLRADRPTGSWTLANHANERTARRIPKSGKQGSRPGSISAHLRSTRFRSPLERMFGFAARALMEAGGIEIAPPRHFTRERAGGPSTFAFFVFFRRPCASCDLKVARERILFL